MLTTRCSPAWLLVIASLVACVEAPELELTAEGLFSPDNLPEFHIDIPQDGYDRLAACTREDNNRVDRPEHCDYQVASLRYIASDDQTVDVPAVGVRLKGRASFRQLEPGAKPGLKIKFGEFVAGQRFLGVRRLTLNSMAQDPSMLRERLSHQIMREAGIAAPRCNHARVFINGELVGLYANVETLDESFVGDRFGDSVGNLYDTYNNRYFTDLDRGRDRSQAGDAVGAQESRFQLETNVDVSDTSDLSALIDAIYASDDADFLAEVEAMLDLDQFLTVAAAQAVLGDWDGFFGARNNYKVYHDMQSDRFVLLPWGTDQTMDRLDYAVDHSNSDRRRAYFFVRCMQAPDCVDRYYAAVERVLDVWSALDLEEAMRRQWWHIAEAASDDPSREYDGDEMRDARNDLSEFIVNREDEVREQVARAVLRR
jgi:spore coat protein CotH